MMGRLRYPSRGVDEQGLATVELALVAPVLLLLIWGAFTFGHAYYVRYLLAASTYAGTRACAVQGLGVADCRALVQQQLPQVVRDACTLDVQPAPDQLSLGPQSPTTVAAMRVDVTCQYLGGVGAAFLGRQGISIRDLKVSALVPY